MVKFAVSGGMIDVMSFPSILSVVISLRVAFLSLLLQAIKLMAAKRITTTCFMLVNFEILIPGYNGEANVEKSYES